MFDPFYEEGDPGHVNAFCKKERESDSKDAGYLIKLIVVCILGFIAWLLPKGYIWVIPASVFGIIVLVLIWVYFPSNKK